MAAALGVRPADRALCAPSLAARQTAAALGLEAAIEPLIRDWDFGRWAGRPVAEVAGDWPAGFQAWMTDPGSAAHGGESLMDLLRRVGPWVAEGLRAPGRTVVVTHAAVIRAAVVCAIEANPATFWHLDVGPLSETWLRSDGRRWMLRSMRA